MPDFMDSVYISNEWEAFSLLCRNSHNVVFSAQNKADGHGAIVTYMILSSNREEIIRAAEQYRSLSKNSHLLPLDKYELVERSDGKYDVFLFSPRRKPFSPALLDEEQKRIFALQIGGALESLHGSDIVHGSVKPENIYAGDDDNWYLAGQVLPQKLLCFAEPTQSPSPGLELDKEPAVENDIHAFGLLLYGLYNDGELPAQIQSPPPRATEPAAAVILKMCAGSSGQPFRTIREAWEALDAAYVPKAQMNQGIQASYPELEAYFPVFDPEASTAFPPPEAKQKASSEIRIVERQKNVLLGAILAIVVAAVLIAFFIIYGLTTTADIETPSPSLFSSQWGTARVIEKLF